MKQFLFLLLFVHFACNPTNNPPAPNQLPVLPERLSPAQTTFIEDWSKKFNPQNTPILSVFRNRYFHKTDLKELHDYCTRNKVSADFSAVEKDLRIKTELEIDTTAVTAINWIQNKDVEACDELDPDFWGCFNLRYSTEKFYYLSMPLFSKDSSWCLLHVALQQKKKGESFGGGRLYHLENGIWNEVAFLSNWGREPY